MKKVKTLSIGLLIVLFAAMPNLFAQTISIDLSTEYQSITGFGGMNNPGWIGDLNADQADKAFGNAPGQIGLSMMRMRISPNSAQFDLEVPTAVLAKNHGVTLYASPWSPPPSLKSNNDPVGGHLLPENYGAYADHLLDFASYMKENDAPLQAISLQNEPDIEVSYESCDWTAQQFINFLEEQGSKFDSIQVIVPESFQFRRPLSDSILNDPEAVQEFDIVGGHIYGGGLMDYPLARDKGKEVWMTEHLTGSSDPSENTWSLALDMAEEINNCMQANFNAYTWWYIRRFYSLINDGGNITKKGYVMSQFTKFVRPGATRVDGTVDSAPNVDVTAYKTDSSFVVVVINQNDTDSELDFTIQNGIVDTLTKFTTSATKNVRNDGGVSISGGTFNATVDANSITTFASYTGNAGKSGNELPVADAGPDLAITDTNGSGTETITLDGSASTDADGSIQHYSWSLNGNQLVWDTASYEVTLDVGEHEAVLTVTDNDGAVAYDTLHITVTSIHNTEIWLDAECAQVGSTWEIGTDEDASNNEYINTPSGTQRLDAPSTDTADLVVFTFHTSETGTYKIWARVITPNPDDDSYWVNVDNDTTWTLWNSIPADNNWHWDDVHDQVDDQPMTYELDTGYHTITICMREDGALLDKLYITNTGAVPSGMGDEDTNCPEDSIPDDPDNIETIGNAGTSISVFPNPAHTEIQVSWDNAFNSLMIMNMDGRKVLQQEYRTPLKDTYLPLQLEPGMYFLILHGRETSGVTKLMIE